MRAVPSGSTCRPPGRRGIRASSGPGASFIAFAKVELVLTQEKAIPGIEGATYVQGETLHDPIFRMFDDRGCAWWRQDHSREHVDR